MKKPTKATLDKIDMSQVLKLIPDSDTNKIYIDQEANKEHYRLLSWIGKKVKKSILEFGSFRGHSALCLAQGGKTVVSVDVENNLTVTNEPDNLNFVIDQNGIDLIDNRYDLIFIDTLHDGIFERKVLDRIRQIDWKGIVIMDDITLFPELKKLWKTIEEPKEDWSDIGHHSGTGIIYFE